MNMEELKIKESYCSLSYSEILADILFVIVIYKEDISKSNSFNTIRNAVEFLSIDEKVDVLICDNSPNSLDIITYSNNYFNLFYLHDSANPGISASYNKAAEFAGVKGKQWLFVLDQDTILPIKALEQYINALKAGASVPIFAPKVYYNGLLISPCHFALYRGSPLVSINSGLHNLKSKNVINSGLLINVSSYQEVGGYDEHVWLYFSDFVFFNRIKAKYKKFFVVDCDLQHELSSSDYTNYTFAIKRFDYYCQGARAASASYESIGAYIVNGVMVGLRSVLMSYRFKKLNFLKVFFNRYILSK